jgi:hypothetical protein
MKKLLYTYTQKYINIKDISPPPVHIDTKASAVNDTASEIVIDLKSSPAIDTTGEFL